MSERGSRKTPTVFSGVVLHVLGPVATIIWLVAVVYAGQWRTNLLSLITNRPGCDVRLCTPGLKYVSLVTDFTIVTDSCRS